MRIIKRHSLLKPGNNYIIDAPTPSNISYWWNAGSLLGLCLVIQIATGVTLAMHYNPSVLEAFNSVEHIMRDVNNGWLIRYLHLNTASAFFFLIYLHIGRGLYYGSYKAPRTLTWVIGTIILILMMATAFLGYVLPYGQMSLWGATVITNLLSAIPWIGQDIVEFIWGGFSVNNATLNRFFSLHFLLPFVLAGLVLMHLIALHDTAGANNPLGISANYDRIPFAPYFVFKDIITVLIFMWILSLFVFFTPNALGDSENYVMANPMQTPPAIVPEWYLLPFYAILRSIPNKLLGVISMFSAILVILFMVLADLGKLRGIQFKPLNKYFFFIFVSNLLLLMVLGAKHVESPFIETGQVATGLYFIYFAAGVPLYNLLENQLNEIYVKVKEFISSQITRSAPVVKSNLTATQFTNLQSKLNSLQLSIITYTIFFIFAIKLPLTFFIHELNFSSYEYRWMVCSIFACINYTVICCFKSEEPRRLNYYHLIFISYIFSLTFPIIVKFISDFANHIELIGVIIVIIYPIVAPLILVMSEGGGQLPSFSEFMSTLGLDSNTSNPRNPDGSLWPLSPPSEPGGLPQIDSKVKQEVSNLYRALEDLDTQLEGNAPGMARSANDLFINIKGNLNYFLEADRNFEQQLQRCNNFCKDMPNGERLTEYTKWIKEVYEIRLELLETLERSTMAAKSLKSGFTIISEVTSQGGFNIQDSEEKKNLFINLCYDDIKNIEESKYMFLGSASYLNSGSNSDRRDAINVLNIFANRAIAGGYIRPEEMNPVVNSSVNSNNAIVNLNNDKIKSNTNRIIETINENKRKLDRNLPRQFR